MFSLFKYILIQLFFLIHLHKLALYIISKIKTSVKKVEINWNTSLISVSLGQIDFISQTLIGRILIHSFKFGCQRIFSSEWNGITTWSTTTTIDFFFFIFLWKGKWFILDFSSTADPHWAYSNRVENKLVSTILGQFLLVIKQHKENQCKGRTCCSIKDNFMLFANKPDFRHQRGCLLYVQYSNCAIP